MGQYYGSDHDGECFCQNGENKCYQINRVETKTFHANGITDDLSFFKRKYEECSYQRSNPGSCFTVYGSCIDMEQWFEPIAVVSIVDLRDKDVKIDDEPEPETMYDTAVNVKKKK